MEPAVYQRFQSVENQIERIEGEFKERCETLSNETRFLRKQNHRLQVRVDELTGTVSKLREKHVQLENRCRLLV